MGIVFGADYLVTGAVSIARKYIAAALVLFIFGKDCKISRGEGAFLFLCFVAYNWYLISNQIA